METNGFTTDQHLILQDQFAAAIGDGLASRYAHRLSDRAELSASSGDLVRKEGFHEMGPMLDDRASSFERTGSSETPFIYNVAQLGTLEEVSIARVTPEGARIRGSDTVLGYRSPDPSKSFNSPFFTDADTTFGIEQAARQQEAGIVYGDLPVVAMPPSLDLNFTDTYDTSLEPDAF